MEQFEPFNIVVKMKTDEFTVEQYDIMYVEDDSHATDDDIVIHRGCRVKNGIIGLDISVHVMRDFGDNEALARAAHNTVLEYIKNELL